jgi:hypothetical protein
MRNERNKKSDIEKDIHKLIRSKQTGKERKLQLANNLNNLLPSSTSTTNEKKKTDNYHLKKIKPRVPMKMAQAMISKAKNRRRKTVEESKTQYQGVRVDTLSINKQMNNTGLDRKYEWTSKSHPLFKYQSQEYKDSLDNRRKQEKKREGTNGGSGVRVGTGKYKNGVLHISSREIREISSSGPGRRQGKSGRW